MRLYSLREPRTFKDDKGWYCQLTEPIVGLPGINCWGVPNACGQIWGSVGTRIRMDLPLDHPLRHRSRKPVFPNEFQAIVRDVRQALHLPEDMVLKPGTDIGLVRIECVRPEVTDFEWPKVHTLVITERVRRLLEDHGLTGWHTEPVIVTQTTEGMPLPKLYEFVVDGCAGEPRVDPPVEVLSTCPVCGFIQYKRDVPVRLEMDDSQWDGSDFMRFSSVYSGLIFVTERVKEVLTNSTLDNYELETMEEAIQGIARVARVQKEADERQQRESEAMMRRIEGLKRAQEQQKTFDF